MHARDCWAPTRCSSPRRRARSSRWRRSTTTHSDGAWAEVTGRVARLRICARRSRSSQPEGPHRHRQPSAVHQGGGGFAAAARAPRGGARPHRPALRRRAVGRVLRRARASGARRAAGDLAGLQHLADRADAGRARAVVAEVDPDVVLVYGDTNSTLAGALAGAQAGIPIGARRGGHALVRPLDARGAQPRARRPRERAAAVLRAGRGREPPARGVGRRGRARRRRDGRRGASPFSHAPASAAIWSRALASLPGSTCLCTAHRAGNVDDPARLERLVELLLALPLPVVLPLHPRTRARLTDAGLLDRLVTAPQMTLTPPLGYVELTALLVQRPGGADRLGRPAEGGVSRRRAVHHAAAKHRVDRDRRSRVERARRPRRRRRRRRARPWPPAERPALYGDGHAGDRVVAALTLRYA